MTTTQAIGLALLLAMPAFCLLSMLMTTLRDAVRK